MEKLNDTWCLWYHHDPHKWTVSSFTKLCTISTVAEYWSMIDGLKADAALLSEHIYIMRDGVSPLWEDSRNREGGCWSVKVDLKDAFTVFAKIVAGVVGENSMYDKENNNLSGHITGVSFCAKNSFNVIIQIWNDSSALNKVSLLNPFLTQGLVADTIFRSHIPEY